MTAGAAAGARPDGADPAGLLVATDLDGTLLDERTYSYAPAEPALAGLRARGARLVLATSKTAGEVSSLARALGPLTVCIVENGGAVIAPAADRPAAPADATAAAAAFVIELGVPRVELLRHLAELAAGVGARVRGFDAMSADEVARRTGLSPADARLACERRYDEPFLLENADVLPDLVAAAARRGLRVTRGGRFLHLTGPADKGGALRAWLAATGRRGSTVGLGDSSNDLSLLQTVDRPVIVPRAGGRLDPDLARALPRAERAPRPGPSGWNDAVLAILAGRTLPAVGEVAR